MQADQSEIQPPTPEATAETLGLTTAQARERAQRGFCNTLPKGGEQSAAAIVRRNVFTLFNLLNLALAALVFCVGSYRNLLFLGVVVSNTVIGLVQELRAKRAHDRLLLLSAGKHRVYRDGLETLLPPDELVLDDVVVLQRGDQLPADAQVLSGAAEVNESLLTGESTPIAKHPGDALLSGSYLTEGSLTARLTAVGAQSYAGALQTAARKVKRPRSQLMDAMNRIIRVVSITLVPVGIALYCKQRFVLGAALEPAVTRTIAAMLGMIPEGLILLTSVALAVGVVRLSRRNALVNELYGIESLARTDVVCLDKTGTLTSGQMTLQELLPLGDISTTDAERMLHPFVAAFPQEDSATQRALRAAFPPKDAEPPLDTVPFSSDRKWSAARFTFGSLTLGAPEKTLPSGSAVLKQAQIYAARGLRVLVLQRTDAPLNGKTLPEGLHPVALLLLSDTLRPDAADTLRYFGEQGVTLKVISGDSPLTVSRIAGQAGLPDAERAVDCSALVKPVDYDALARDYAVFGRVSPEDKRELVHALKRQGHSVAMIGDGVNDIPALKAADCSIAMAGGSDAACRVSQLTLLDADFSVMPQIVLEGRRVINNITRASSLFLVKNIFSFLLAVALLALPFVYPFAPIQLTLISSLTVGFPSFVLALQPSRDRVKGGFFATVLRRALPGGLTIALVSLAILTLSALLGLTVELEETLCTYAAAFCSWCVLADTCRPFNALRATLALLMAATLVGAILLLPGVFYFVPLTGAAPWVLVGACASIPALLWAFSKATAAAFARRERKAGEAKTVDRRASSDV